MLKRIIAGAGIAVILAGALAAAFFYDGFYITVLFCVILFLGTIETARAAKLPKCFKFLLFLYAATFCVLTALCLKADGFEFLFERLPLYMLAAFFIAGATAIVFTESNAAELMKYVFILIYPAVLISPIFYLNNLDGKLYVFAAAMILLTSTMTDATAYFTGVLFGKHKLTKISPKKTVEGAIGGAIGGILGAVCLYLIVNVFNLMTLDAEIADSLWFYLASGLCCSFITQIGDLTASVFKRHFGIKDFGKILLSHGGIMDRFDGIILNGCFFSVFLSIALSVAA